MNSDDFDYAAYVMTWGGPEHYLQKVWKRVGRLLARSNYVSHRTRQIQNEIGRAITGVWASESGLEHQELVSLMRDSIQISGDCWREGVRVWHKAVERRMGPATPILWSGQRYITGGYAFTLPRLDASRSARVFHLPDKKA